MARFRGTLTGASGKTVSRLGHKGTGLTTKANGWTAGIRVDARAGFVEEDIFDVYVTDGSSSKGRERLVFSLTAEQIQMVIDGGTFKILPPAS